MSNPAVPSIPSFQQPWYSSLCVSLGCSDWWSLNLYCPSESALVLQEKIHGPDCQVLLCAFGADAFGCWFEVQLAA